MKKEKLKPPKLFREIEQSCATCGLLDVDANKNEIKCKRPGGPFWSERRKEGSARRYVCSGWVK